MSLAPEPPPRGDIGDVAQKVPEPSGDELAGADAGAAAAIEEDAGGSDGAALEIWVGVAIGVTDRGAAGEASTASFSGTGRGIKGWGDGSCPAVTVTVTGSLKSSTRTSLTMVLVTNLSRLL